MWSIDFQNTEVINWEMSDGIWGRTPDNREERTPFRGVYFEELAPPDQSQDIWSVRIEDTGVDASDFSFWLNAEALFLVEPRNQGYVFLSEGVIASNYFEIARCGGFIFDISQPTTPIHVRSPRLSTLIKNHVQYGRTVS